MIKTLFVFANPQVRDQIINDVKSGKLDLKLGTTPTFMYWENVVTRIASNVVLNSAPRPTLKQEAERMIESELNYVVFTVESESIHYVPCYVLAGLVRMYQITASGRIIELAGRTLNPQ